MILNKCRLIETVASGLLFVSMHAMAVDAQVKVTGTILIPPCKVNEGEIISVKFEDVSVEDVTNERNRRTVTVPVKCSYTQGMPYIRVTGSRLGKQPNVLATNVKNFGIALYQGDSVSTNLILGSGNFNGMEYIGYPINSGLSGKENGKFTFTVMPYKESGENIEVGSFFASANMSISYF